MVAPYHRRFRVTQIQSATHDGLDLQAITSKYVYSTVAGTVVRAGWENPDDHSQGFGQRIVIRNEKSQMRFVVKYILTHKSLFLIHDVWRVAQDHVEASSKDIVRRNICQYIRLDEGRSNGARRPDLICEVLR